MVIYQGLMKHQAMVLKSFFVCLIVFLVSLVALICLLVFGAKNPVARIAQTRHDIGFFVQMRI
jgi:hypothetical protein